MSRQESVSVVIFGFSKHERRLLENILRLSANRPLRLAEPPRTYTMNAVNATDTAAMALLDADDAVAIDDYTAYILDRPPLATVKLSAKPHSDPHQPKIQRRFVPLVILIARDTMLLTSNT